MAVQIFLSIGGTLCLFMIFWAVGAFILSRRCLGVLTEEPLLDACAGIGLGFGIAGNGVMALCFFHCASPGALRWLCAVLFFVSLPLAWRQKDLIVRCAESVGRSFRAAHIIVVAALLALVAGYFFRGLLPPSDFDGLMYHCAVAKLYLENNGFFHVFFNPQANFPMLTEMNFMLGLAWGNDIICKTISFGLGVLPLAVIAVLCKRHCADSRLAPGACLVYLTFTNTIATMSDCYVDIPQAVWTILSVLFMECFCENGRRRYALIAGAFCGMAMQTKIFGVFVLPILLVQLLSTAKTRGGKKNWTGAAAIVLPALLLALPWYAKSFMFSGTIFSIGHGTIESQGLGRPMGVATQSGLAYWLMNTVVRAASAPWAFSLFPHLHQSDSFGPLLLAVLPFMLFVKVPRRVRGLVLYAGIFMAGILFMEMWFIPGGSSIRYSTVLLMISSPLIVWTVSQMKAYPAARRMCNAFVIVMVVCGMALFVKRYHKEWKALATNMPRDAYYASVLPEYPVIKAINALHDGSVVMPVYNFSNYLIDVPYVAAYRKYGSLADMKADLREKNIRYVFANDKLDTTGNRNPLPEITDKECVAGANGFYLFKIRW
jgi:Dolichyl-phosphate-mannose-protein mannosyltransferase